ncbi:YraN family protein [Brevibacillus sp. H7]|uniref:YraN family protein n=1 Tax=Brevibacillus sp. H7 TaxID=3349138 RepID=UPI0037F26E79
MSLRRKQLGQKGESVAERFLQSKGYQTVARNVRSRHGEIDLIAMDGDTLVFVEVRTRSGFAYGTPTESVTWRKRRKLQELALAYLQNCSQPVKHFRFDVIGIVYVPAALQPRIDHIIHAF